MAPTKTCLRLSGNPLLQEAFQCQKPPSNRYSHSFRPSRPYSSSNQSAKPRPYSSPTKSKPLVGTRTPAPPPRQSSTPRNPSTAKAPPNVNPTSKGVFAPYWRISIGVVFCGSLIYSMVPFLPNSLPVQSSPTYMPVHLPPTARGAFHRRPRLPRKARIRRNFLLAYASPHGSVHQSSAERDRLNPRDFGLFEKVPHGYLDAAEWWWRDLVRAPGWYRL